MKQKHIEAQKKMELQQGICDWSYTFTIIHFKKVNYQGKYKEFKKFTDNEQKEILKKVLSVCDDLLLGCDIHYETHQQMNKNCLHAHGTIFNTSNFCMREIQKKVCEYVGVKGDSLWEYFYFVPTFSSAGWQTYCMKEIEKEKRIEALVESVKSEEDKCIVKFDRYNTYLFI